MSSWRPLPGGAVTLSSRSWAGTSATFMTPLCTARGWSMSGISHYLLEKFFSRVSWQPTGPLASQCQTSAWGFQRSMGLLDTIWRGHVRTQQSMRKDCSVQGSMLFPGDSSCRKAKHMGLRGLALWDGSANPFFAFMASLGCPSCSRQSLKASQWGNQFSYMNLPNTGIISLPPPSFSSPQPS